MFHSSFKELFLTPSLLDCRVADYSFKKKVRVEGLEPPRREALDPKSSMSTNFITPAKIY